MPYPKPRPTKHRFAVKKSASGLGLFAKTPIRRWDFVIEYWGEIISDDEAQRRGGKYLFNIADTKLTIDGTTRKNTARYINHSCKPNCEVIEEGNRIFIRAIRSIQPGEEITYDYGWSYFNEYIGRKNCRCGHHRNHK